MTGRQQTLTTKVPTRFGSIYVHCMFNNASELSEVSISTPGKHADTAVEAAMVALGLAITACLPGNTKGEE